MHRYAVENLRLPVLIVVVGVSGRVAVVPRLARDLIAVVVPESRDRSVGVGSSRDVVDAVVSIGVVCESDVCPGFVQDVFRLQRLRLPDLRRGRAWKRYEHGVQRRGATDEDDLSHHKLDGQRTCLHSEHLPLCGRTLQQDPTLQRRRHA